MWFGVLNGSPLAQPNQTDLIHANVHIYMYMYQDLPPVPVAGPRPRAAKTSNERSQCSNVGGINFSVLSPGIVTEEGRRSKGIYMRSRW